MDLLQDRRDKARERLASLRARLGDVAARVRGRACVFVTGSYGRGEASSYSDLDFFIVMQSAADELALEVQNGVYEAARELRFPLTEGTAEYKLVHPVERLVRNIGQSEDDGANTLTARLLLLLESRPLLGEDVYQAAIASIVESYWRDFPGHEAEFVPGFLANDILRMWRTFCVNYEARTSSDPPEKKAKRALKNYKLKHSRLLACFSALADMLVRYGERGTVTPDDAKEMVSRSPIERIEWVGERIAEAHWPVDRIREQYRIFLARTDAPETELVERLRQSEERKRLFEEALELGDWMYELIGAIGRGSRLHRILLV